MRRHTVTLVIITVTAAVAASCATAHTDNPAAPDDMVIWIAGDSRYLRQSATTEAWDLALRPLLPDEHTCADVTG